MCDCSAVLKVSAKGWHCIWTLVGLVFPLKLSLLIKVYLLPALTTRIFCVFGWGDHFFIWIDAQNLLRWCQDLKI